MNFFTADTHINHFNIIKYCYRPFETAQEMDKVIIENTNTIVKANDVLWHLGDTTWVNPQRYFEQLKCKKINVIMGNHDRKNKKQLKELAAIGRIELYEGFIDTSINGQKITLCHYPMRSWNCSYHGAWHLFGHVHGRGQVSWWSMDVGVDSNNFMPVSFDQVKAYMEKHYGEKLKEESHPEIL